MSVEDPERRPAAASGPGTFIGVPDSAMEDRPSSVIGYIAEPAPSSGVTQSTEDPKERHQRDIELSKLKFSYFLIAGCVLLIVILSVLDAWFTPKDGALTSALDVLKTVALMAIGFVFGNAVAANKSD